MLLKCSQNRDMQEVRLQEMGYLKIYRTNRMYVPHLALVNLAALFIVTIIMLSTLLVYVYEYIIAMHPACKASRTRINLPISGIRKLKVRSADRITEQVQEPAVLTPSSLSLDCLNQP